MEFNPISRFAEELLLVWIPGGQNVSGLPIHPHVTVMCVSEMRKSLDKKEVPMWCVGVCMSELVSARVGAFHSSHVGLVIHSNGTIVNKGYHFW